MYLVFILYFRASFLTTNLSILLYDSCKPVLKPAVTNLKLTGVLCIITVQHNDDNFSFFPAPFTDLTVSLRMELGISLHLVKVVVASTSFVLTLSLHYRGLLYNGVMAYISVA